MEKLLKTILTEKGIEFGRIHNIIGLKNAVIHIGYSVNITDEEAIFLNSVYRARYPSDIGMLPEGTPVQEDAKKALNRQRERLMKF